MDVYEIHCVHKLISIIVGYEAAKKKVVSISDTVIIWIYFGFIDLDKLQVKMEMYFILKQINVVMSWQ
jgi:hypothetical protein